MNHHCSKPNYPAILFTVLTVFAGCLAWQSPCLFHKPCLALWGASLESAVVGVLASHVCALAATLFCDNMPWNLSAAYAFDRLADMPLIIIIVFAVWQRPGASKKS